MLSMIKTLKNEKSGYIMIYVVLIMGFITVLFAGTAMALNNRNAVTKTTVNNQQLQVTAQSALSTIVEEFENNGELKAKLKEYAEGNQSAMFSLTDETGVDDNIEVKISKEPDKENTARITVIASDETGSISTAFALMNYAEPPQGESAGVVDNLIVAYSPEGLTGSQNTLISGEGIYNKTLEGRVVINNTTDTVKVKRGSVETVITNQSVEFFDNAVVNGTNPDLNGILASLNGTVTLRNGAVVEGQGFDKIAGAGGVSIMTDNFTWDAENTHIISKNNGNIDIKAMTGKIGSIVSGGNVYLEPKDNNPLTVNGSIESGDDITLSEQNKVQIVVNGNVLSGEDLEIKGKYKVNGNVSAVSNIDTIGQLDLTANHVLAGHNLNLGNISALNLTGSTLSGANYRNEDSSEARATSYLNYKKRGTTTISGNNININGKIVANDNTQGKGSIANSVKDKLIRLNDSGFASIFLNLNNAWLEDMKSVEIGYANGFVNLAAAVQNPDTTKWLSDWKLSLEEDEKAYFTHKEDTNVSHGLGYTYDPNEYIMNRVDKEFLTIENEIFNQAVPEDAEGNAVIPDVTVPDYLTYTYATVRQDGDNDVAVVSSGYIQVNGETLTAKAEGGSELITINLPKGGNLHFDTHHNKTYDVLFGTGDVSASTSDCDVTVPWSICVNQPEDEESMGYVRIFAYGNSNLKFQGNGYSTSVVNTGTDLGVIPEVYFFSNSNGKIEVDNYYLTGYVIMPHGLFDLQRTAREPITNRIFEGIVLCGNIGFSSNEEVLIYKRPVTYLEAITSDIFAS